MDNRFAKRLIKGRIAETVFEQMFSEVGYKVIPFGYERAMPELMHYCKASGAKKVIDNFRSAPDFAVISPNQQMVYLVEVKFRSILDNDEVVKIAKNQLKRWNPSWLFITTKEGFYLDEVSDIVESGKILLMGDEVDSDIQSKYLKLIQEFEK